MSGTLSIGDKTVLSHDTNTDVVTLENTTLSNTVLGLPTIPTQVFAYGMGINEYDGTKVKYSSKRISSGITLGTSDN